MGIKDRYKAISANASARTAMEPSLENILPRVPRTGPGRAAEASRLFSEEKQELLDTIEGLRKQLEEAQNNSTSNEADAEEIARLRAELQAKESEYGIKLLPVAHCHIKPATASRPIRKRRLSDKDFEALRKSIKAVGMSVPILVEPREEGGYWIVAGHNRHEVHVVENIELIRAEVVNPDELDVESAALVSNLLTPELGTYEFYRGIKFFRDELNKSLGEIAEMTGRGKSSISEYFCLDNFPLQALEFLEESNLQIGSNALTQLEKLITPENTNDIVQALADYSKGSPWKAVIENLLNSNKNAKSPKPSGAEVLTIERNGKPFATVSQRNNSLSIRFAGKSIPQDVVEKINKILYESNT